MYAEIIDDTKKMFRAIINVQSAMKSELLAGIPKLEKKVGTEIGDLKTALGSLRSETKEGVEKLTKGLDKIGLQVARLEDDMPTRNEFDAGNSRLK